MLTEQTVGNARAWRMFEAIGLGAVGVTLFAVIVINLALIPPVLIFGVLYLLLGVAVWRWIDQPRVALGAAVLGLVGLIRESTIHRRGLGAHRFMGVVRAERRRRGARHHIAADGFKHGVADSPDLGEILHVIVDHFIGSEAAQVLVVGSTGRGNHAGAEVFRQLDRHASDAARAALDQDRFARSEVERVLH